MILSVHGITKSFDGKDILRDASFHVENNEKVAIVGINGAGKTTLLKLIIGELSPDDGDVTFSKDVIYVCVILVTKFYLRKEGSQLRIYS